MLSFQQHVICLFAGVVLDACFGELRRWHPLVGFGMWAQFLEKMLNTPGANRWTGAQAWCMAVLPWLGMLTVAVFCVAIFSTGFAMLLEAIVLYFCLGLRSLREHCLPIQTALENDDLVEARRLTARIVSRDTHTGDAVFLAKATVESLLENGCDAVFATLFWFLIAGAPGAILYRLSNTLDAMWGYRTERFLRFGCVAARIDDVLNFIPARLTALSYLVLGNRRLAWQCWRTQADHWDSPNAGPVMAAGAGALNLQLGGAAVYHGRLEQRPALGEGALPAAQDITRAWLLVRNSAYAWLVLSLVAAILLGGIHA